MKWIHYIHRLRGLLGAYYRGEIPLSKVNASVQCWVNHARYSNTVGLRKAVLSCHLIEHEMCYTLK
jgi:hypothetical protein